MTPKQWLTLSDGSILTRQEQFVLRQVAAGEIADLKQEFGEAEADRRLSARFLENLLTGNLQDIKIHRRGVGINNAIIENSLDLANSEICQNIYLINCIFREKVNFRDANLTKHLILTGTQFDKHSDFHRVKVLKDFFCKNATFKSTVNFAAADIGGQFNAEGAIFGTLGRESKADFYSLKVGYDAFLRGAIFQGYANFKLIHVIRNLFLTPLETETQIKNTIFNGAVNFGGAHIGGQLGALAVKFQDKDQDVSFNGIRVGQDARFDGAEFHGPVSFVGANINRQFGTAGAKFLAKNKEVNFNQMQVGQNALFEGCDFHGPVNFNSILIKGIFQVSREKRNSQMKSTIFRDSVDFGGANIGSQLIAQGAKFLCKDRIANFNGMRVAEVAFFDDAEFHGPVNFAGIDIDIQFVANGAKFLAPNYKVDFNRMQIGQDAFFRGSEFHGVVDFVLIKIAGNLNLEPMLELGNEISTTFRSHVNFHGAEIGGELLADKAQFLGHIVNFEAMKVGRSFHASGAIFAGSVNFTEMQVKSNFYLNPFGRIKFFKTLFKGAANFSDLEVRGVFNADQAIFQSESTIFSGLKVGQGAFFIGTIFFGGLVLKEGQLTDLVIRGLHRLSKGGLPLTEIVLNRTKIAHRLTIEDVEVKRFDARNLEVKGPAEFSRVLIKAEADFRDAAIHHLQLVEVDWPEPKDSQTKVFLDGLTYESLTTRKEPDKPEDWPKLLGWLGLSRFNTQNYGRLDGFFQRGGLRKWADKVYIAGKRRELGRRKWWDPARWLTKFFWGLLAGYGRKPGRTLWISLLLIILGAFILNPAEVLPPDFLNNLAGYQDNVVHLIALRLIVSFFSFVAAIPGWGGHLSLASPEFHLFVYLWFQRICGWILIPIGLAAVYTRLK